MVFDIPNSQTDKEILIEAELRSVSKDYYTYHTEGYRHETNGDNTFLNDPTVVSNNIENGFGVFAGYTTRSYRAVLEE